MPASLGAHPAFRWPLADGIPKDAHELEFETDEPAPVSRLDNGLLGDTGFPTPVEGRRLRLNDALFAEDALILKHPASRSVRYTAPGAERRSSRFHGRDSNNSACGRRRAAISCASSPGRGFTSPAGFDADFSQKPGLMHIPREEAGAGLSRHDSLKPHFHLGFAVF